VSQFEYEIEGKQSGQNHRADYAAVGVHSGPAFKVKIACSGCEQINSVECGGETMCHL
jgi:hypothetical protein